MQFKEKIQLIINMKINNLSMLIFKNKTKLRIII